MVFLIESIVACAVFSLFVYLISRNPVKIVYNYPPAIIDSCRSLGLVDDSNRRGGMAFYVKKVTAMALFGVLLGLLVRYVKAARPSGAGPSLHMHSGMSSTGSTPLNGCTPMRGKSASTGRGLSWVATAREGQKQGGPQEASGSLQKTCKVGNMNRLLTLFLILMGTLFYHPSFGQAVRDGSYRTVTHIKSDGTIQDHSYRTIGHAGNIPRKWAAFYFFFSK